MCEIRNDNREIIKWTDKTETIISYFIQLYAIICENMGKIDKFLEKCTKNQIHRRLQQTNFHRRVWENYQTDYPTGQKQKHKKCPVQMIIQFTGIFYFAFEEQVLTSKHGKWTEPVTLIKKFQKIAQKNKTIDQANLG